MLHHEEEVQRGQSQDQPFPVQNRPFSLRLLSRADGSTVEEPLLLTVSSPTTCAQPSDECHISSLQEMTQDEILCPGEDTGHQHPRAPDQAVVHPAGRDPHRPHFDNMPMWIHQIWHNLETEGVVEDDEEGPIVYYNTYYISHWTNPTQRFGRAVRLDRTFATWEDDLRMVWDDLCDPSEPLEVDIVSPESPVTLAPDTIGTLLITQHPHADRAACITTAVIQGIPFRVIEVAHSFERVVGQRQALFHAEVLELCDRREDLQLGACKIRVGRYEYPPGRPLRVHDGLRFQVDVPPPIAQADWETCLHQQLRQPCNQSQHEEESEETGLMARSPMPALNRGHSDPPPPSSSSATSSSASPDSNATEDHSSAMEDLEWHLAIVFTPFDAEREVEVPWYDGPVLYQRIAHRFGMPSTAIAAVHTVLPCPPDILQDERRALLLQLHQDQPRVDTMSLVLVDVEYKADQHNPKSLLRRKAIWIPSRITRPSLIRFLGHEGSCHAEPDRCWLWHNLQYLEMRDSQILQFEHGNYVKLAIPAHPEIPLCETGEYYWPSDLNSSMDDISEPESDHSATLQIADQAIHPLSLTPSSATNKSGPLQCSWTDAFLQAVQRLRDAADAQALPEFPAEDRIDIGFLAPWVREVHDAWVRLASPGPGNVELLGRLETWFTDHLEFRRCWNSRVAVLAEDYDGWEDQIKALWRDRLVNNAPLEFHLVTPLPEDAAVNIIGQLVLVQRPMAFHRSLLR
eukprot:s136_g14.t1